MKTVLSILQKMGAKLSWQYKSQKMAKSGYAGEAAGSIEAKSAGLKAVTISPREVPLMIDELPILMVAASQAEGQTKICGAGELRVKETDRIKAMVSNLSKMGADIADRHNDIIINGPARLVGAEVDSFGDHRIAMSMAIAGLVAKGNTSINDADCVNVSYPGFFKALAGLTS